jgi:hypothetical protein
MLQQPNTCDKKTLNPHVRTAISSISKLCGVVFPSVQHPIPAGYSVQGIHCFENQYTTTELQDVKRQQQVATEISQVVTHTHPLDKQCLAMNYLKHPRYSLHASNNQEAHQWKLCLLVWDVGRA